MKKLIIIALLLNLSVISYAQDTDKTVSITVSGSGKTQEQAKQSALLSAIEQAFGAFISTKTEMFNDQIVADQMASVSSGNIKSYDVLNISQLPNGSWGVTLKVLVSVSKLTSFVEAKGVAIEIKGGLFALNIKQQSLNELSETKAICEMVGLLHEPMQLAFDYNIKSGEPKSLDEENKNWEIPIEVNAIANKNMDFCANYCIKTLAALSLSSNEITSYKSLNKPVFPIVINYKGVAKTFNLRKQRSIDALNTFASQFKFYTTLFTVESGVNEKINNGYQIKFIHKFLVKSSDYKKLYGISFPIKGEIAATFSSQYELTLTKIEKITGFTVKPSGVISLFKHGGFVVYEVPTSYQIGIQVKPKNSNLVSDVTIGGVAEKAGILKGDKIISINDIEVVNGNIKEIINSNNNLNKLCVFKIERDGGATDTDPKIFYLNILPTLEKGYGLVASIIDLGEMDWDSANKACEDLILNGYIDWHLPTILELEAVFSILWKKDIGGFSKDHNKKDYWSSIESNFNSDLAQYKHLGYYIFESDYKKDSAKLKSEKCNVRAVRTF